MVQFYTIKLKKIPIIHLKVLFSSNFDFFHLERIITFSFFKIFTNLTNFKDGLKFYICKMDYFEPKDPDSKLLSFGSVCNEYRSQP
jgi:hypothetical protein